MELLFEISANWKAYSHGFGAIILLVCMGHCLKANLSHAAKPFSILIIA